MNSQQKRYKKDAEKASRIFAYDALSSILAMIHVAVGSPLAVMGQCIREPKKYWSELCSATIIAAVIKNLDLSDAFAKAAHELRGSFRYLPDLTSNENQDSIYLAYKHKYMNMCDARERDGEEKSDFEIACRQVDFGLVYNALGHILAIIDMVVGLDTATKMDFMGNPKKYASIFCSEYIVMAAVKNSDLLDAFAAAHDILKAELDNGYGMRCLPDYMSIENQSLIYQAYITFNPRPAIR